MKTLRCKNQLLSLANPLVMGILNCSPESFYSASRLTQKDTFLKQAEIHLTEGAAFLDVGGQSTRPGAKIIGEEAELTRVLPFVELLEQNFPKAKISIDTQHAKVAKYAVEAGACLVNDVSGGMFDDAMLQTVGTLQVPYCMMHMRGTPATMQLHTDYENIISEMLYFFSTQITKAREAGITDIIIDPGFGFAKTKDQNFEILKKLSLFSLTNLPILVGLSRKSMIYKTLEISPEKSLPATSALHMIALQNKASILRVHDVKQAQECITLWEHLNNVTI